MSASRWLINRIGLIDFWYYDDEEFQFSEGRLLLRGANGSGKSVTMQSFIPLLLDGNKASERLDPFGTKARKLENYLLEENDDRDERTGYLYMEFKREDSDTYLTLGIGLRARKNKKLDSWHFVITDGRRIGKDFFLYKNLDQKITLSRQELLLRLGEGGQLIDSPKDYMKVVNDKLFGYSNIEEFKELVDLLIQLRTPKLSKDLKPTILNEILSDSLPPLSDDDLRPMSEAIENMDTLKTQLDSLQESKKASERIMDIYKQYNQCALYDKAQKFVQSCKEYENSLQKRKDFIKEIENTKKQLDTENSHAEALTLEENDLDKQLASLDQHNLQRLIEQQKKLKDELAKATVQQSEKEKAVQTKKEKEIDCRKLVNRKQESVDILHDDIDKKCHEMEEIFEQYSFDEHAFMTDDLLSHINESYNFSPLFLQIQNTQKTLEEGCELLKNESEKRKLYDEKQVERDLELKTKEQLDLQKNQLEEELETAKNQWIEDFYKWSRDNKECLLSSELERSIVVFVQQFCYGMDFDTSHDKLREVYEENRTRLKNEEWKLKKALEEQKAQLQELHNKLTEWENKKDPEPEKTDAVKANRLWLNEQGIAFEPLYKVLDFTEQVPDDRKNRLEEALYRMGILDACVVPEHLRDKVMKKPDGMCDSYLFSGRERIKENVTKLLDISMEQSDIVFYQQLNSCLQAIGLTQEGSTCILEDGSFRIGVLEGTVSGQYEAKYIGAKSRESFRQKKLEEIHTLLKHKETEVHDLEAKADILSDRILLCEEEFRSYPVESNIKLIAKEVFEKTEEIERILHIIDTLDEKIKTLEQEIVDLRKAISEVSKKVYIKAELPIFIQALREMNLYEKEVFSLQNLHQSYLHESEMLLSLKEQLEQILDDLDNLVYDLTNLKRNTESLSMELTAIENQLSMSDYQEIIQKIEACTQRLSNIKAERSECTLQVGKLTNQLNNLEKDRESIDAGLQVSALLKALYEKGFVDEWELELVEEKDESDPILKARQFCDTLWNGQGKSFMEMSEALQESYHKYKGEMAEFSLITKYVFSKEEYDEFRGTIDPGFRRIIILAKYKGKEVGFQTLVEGIRQDVEIQKNLVKESDRTLFEDILAHTISKKIRSRIYHSDNWVATMNGLMNQMNTSSGLKLHLIWKKKKAEEEGQLDTGKLVELLKKDAGIMTEEELNQLSLHFQSKVQEARRQQEDLGNTKSFHSIMKEVLDYRKWFEFQLYYEKTGEKRRELTNNAFFTFSGGEKAMSMYVPLFSAVVAKYHGAREDAPRLVSLDEAFAGVDDNNIKDMFRLMVDCEFEFIINSQILWGDVETLPSLSIYQLLRPENAKFVSVIQYHWDGKSKQILL